MYSMCVLMKRYYVHVYMHIHIYMYMYTCLYNVFLSYIGLAFRQLGNTPVLMVSTTKAVYSIILTDNPKKVRTCTYCMDIRNIIYTKNFTVIYIQGGIHTEFFGPRLYVFPAIQYYILIRFNC